MNGLTNYLAEVAAGLGPFDQGAQQSGIAPPPAPPAGAPPMPVPPPPGPSGPMDPFNAGAQNAGVAPISFAPDPEKFSPLMGVPSGPSISVPGVSAPPPPPNPPPGQQPPPSPPPSPAPNSAPVPMAANGMPSIPGVPSFGPMPFGPSAPQVGATAGAAADQNAGESSGEQFPLVSVPGGGTIPAHEVERRGPTYIAAQRQANDTNEQAIRSIQQRASDLANEEYAIAYSQEQSARARQQAVEQAALEQEEELQQRQADFDTSVRHMGRLAQVDRGRVWASMSTPQKIAGFLELAAAGMRNAPSLVINRINDDVAAQEKAYNAARDQVSARQSAFAMAMQKYNNANAARAMARAAGIDVAQAQLAQVAAKAKGSDAASNADIAHAHLQDLKAEQIRTGIQFVGAQSSGPVFIDRETGLPYDLAGARKESAAWRERRQAQKMKVADVGGQLVVEDARAGHAVNLEGVKAQNDRTKNAANFAVTIPMTGETVHAPSAEEAAKLRGVIDATATAGRLVNEAKQIRAKATLGVPYTKEARARLNQIQAELLTEFGVQHQLGALSDKDYDIAQKGTADLFAFGSGVEARLDRLNEQATARLRTRVSTYPNAPATAPRALGRMPEGFVPRGQ